MIIIIQALHSEEPILQLATEKIECNEERDYQERIYPDNVTSVPYIYGIINPYVGFMKLNW